MKDFYIRDTEHARAIIAAYEHCSTCDNCPLNTPTGWRCEYLYRRAVEYLEKHK